MSPKRAPYLAGPYQRHFGACLACRDNNHPFFRAGCTVHRAQSLQHDVLQRKAVGVAKVPRAVVLRGVVLSGRSPCAASPSQPSPHTAPARQGIHSLTWRPLSISATLGAHPPMRPCRRGTSAHALVLVVCGLLGGLAFTQLTSAQVFGVVDPVQNGWFTVSTASIQGTETKTDTCAFWQSGGNVNNNARAVTLVQYEIIALSTSSASPKSTYSRVIRFTATQRTVEDKNGYRELDLTVSGAEVYCLMPPASASSDLIASDTALAESETMSLKGTTRFCRYKWNAGSSSYDMLCSTDVRPAVADFLTSTTSRYSTSQLCTVSRACWDTNLENTWAISTVTAEGTVRADSCSSIASNGNQWVPSFELINEQSPKVVGSFVSRLQKVILLQSRADAVTGIVRLDVANVGLEISCLQVTGDSYANQKLADRVN